MNKKQVQQRVLQDGKKLALSKFSWDEKTKTFASIEKYLVIDFNNVNSATIKAGDFATINAGDFATINAGYSATIKAGDSATIKAGGFATIKAGGFATIKAGDSATIDAGYSATIDAGYSATIKAGDSATIKAGGFATIDAGYSATIDAGYSATIKAGHSATIDAGHSATIDAGDECVVVRRDIYQVIEISNDSIQLCPYTIKGYMKNGIYSETDKPAILADGILSEIKSKKQSKNGIVYKVVNHGATKWSYLIEVDGIFSHGATLKEAKESYKYKITNRDTSQYDQLTQESALTDSEAIKLYMAITGACSSGTRYFVENLNNAPKKMTVNELIKLTKNQYNHDLLVKFFKK